jgi:hypothetical protein
VPDVIGGGADQRWLTATGWSIGAFVLSTRVAGEQPR